MQLREPTPFQERKATPRRERWPGAEVPPGSKSRACTQGVPQEPGRSCRLRRSTRVGRPGQQEPRPAWGRPPGPVSEDEDARWYRRAKATKRGGMGDRKSERLTVPRKRGTAPRDPAEGRGAGTWNRWRERWREHRARRHLNETPADSGTGEESAGDGVHDPGPSHRPECFAGGLSADAQGRRRGVDGQTAAEYAANLEGNLRSLLERCKSGTYRAPPVRRVHIPKGDGSQDAADRHTDLRGQGPPAGGRHGAGADLRAGLSGRARTASGRALGAPGAGSAVGAG